MSFSFTAGGTQQQAISSLVKVTHHDELGQAAADLLIKAVGSGPDEVVDEKRPHYSASAYGHSGHGSLPSLSVSLGVTYVPVPEPEEPAGS